MQNFFLTMLIPGVISKTIYRVQVGEYSVVWLHIRGQRKTQGPSVGTSPMKSGWQEYSIYLPVFSR